MSRAIRRGMGLLDLRTAVERRSSGSCKNVERLHNTVGGKQRHLSVGSNIILFLSHKGTISFTFHNLVLLILRSCSVVVYDFDPNKQVIRYAPRDEKTKQEKLDFLGGPYPAHDKGKITSKENAKTSDFEWIGLKEYKEGQKYKYYLIKFK